MNGESAAKLLRAYRCAIEADQDGIADLLEDVILDMMDSATRPVVGSNENSVMLPPCASATHVYDTTGTVSE